MLDKKSLLLFIYLSNQRMKKISVYQLFTLGLRLSVAQHLFKTTLLTVIKICVEPLKVAGFLL